MAKLVTIPLKERVECYIFFRLLLSNCLNWKIYCDDQTSLSSHTAVQIWIISYIFHIIYSILPFVLEEWMASLVCLAAVIWVVTLPSRQSKAQAGITSKQKSLLKYHAPGIIDILWILTLDWTIEVLLLDTFRLGNTIAPAKLVPGASEERPEHTLVTCLPESGNLSLKGS